MKLNLKERVQMGSFLPDSGSMAEIGAILSIIKKVEFTKEEMKEFSIVVDDDLITWDVEKEKEKKIDLSLAETNLLVKTLQVKDQQGILSTSAITLYEKIKQLEK